MGSHDADMAWPVVHTQSPARGQSHSMAVSDVNVHTNVHTAERDCPSERTNEVLTTC